MTEIDALPAWLRQQLDEDAHIARETPNASLDWEHDDLVHEIRDVGNGGTVAQVAREGNGEHIARHDPARVLRAAEAKRQLVDELLAERHNVEDDPWYTCGAATEDRDGGETIHTAWKGKCTCGRDRRVAHYLSLLAAEYADRPGYRKE